MWSLPVAQHHYQSQLFLHILRVAHPVSGLLPGLNRLGTVILIISARDSTFEAGLLAQEFFFLGFKLPEGHFVMPQSFQIEWSYTESLDQVWWWTRIALATVT
jgi:hypothetical protein